MSLKNIGKLSVREAGTDIRKAAWTISEGLRLNGLDLSSGSDQILVEILPALFKKQKSNSQKKSPGVSGPCLHSR